MAYIDNHRTGVSSHEQAQALPELIEPAIVTSVFITGGMFEITDTCVRLVGWEQVSSSGGEPERRIVTRMVMSDSTARELMGALRRALEKGGN